MATTKVPSTCDCGLDPLSNTRQIGLEVSATHHQSLNQGTAEVGRPVSVVSQQPTATGAELALRREGAYVGNTNADPSLKLALRPDTLVVDAYPAVHLTASHHEGMGVGPAEQVVGPRRLRSQEQSALATCADRHAAVDQERQPAEHRSLRKPFLCVEQLAEAVGEILVKRHHKHSSMKTGNLRLTKRHDRCTEASAGSGRSLTTRFITRVEVIRMTPGSAESLSSWRRW